jgi:hypothetical protein
MVRQNENDARRLVSFQIQGRSEKFLDPGKFNLEIGQLSRLFPLVLNPYITFSIRILYLNTSRGSSLGKF